MNLLTLNICKLGLMRLAVPAVYSAVAFGAEQGHLNGHRYEWAAANAYAMTELAKLESQEVNCESLTPSAAHLGDDLIRKPSVMERKKRFENLKIAFAHEQELVKQGAARQGGRDGALCSVAIAYAIHRLVDLFFKSAK